MAAKKDTPNLSYSVINAGEEYFDTSCTPCDRKNLNKKASRYCTSCRQYLCVTCTESHNNFPALAGHTLLDPNVKRPSTSKAERKYHAVPTELCKRHHQKCVDMYCSSHDTVGCYVCIMLDHKSCDDIHYIPEYILSPLPTEQTKHISDELATAIKKMGTVKSQHANSNGNLEKSRARCKRDIDFQRRRINSIINNLEAATLLDLETKYKRVAKSADDITQKARNLHDEMVRFKSEIESDICNDSQKFVIAKLINAIIAQGNEFELQATQDLNVDLTYSTNLAIKTFLSKLVQLGTIQQPKKQLSKPVRRKGVARLLNKPGLYQMVYEKEYSIKLQDEKNTCDICSCCFLDNGDILMTDNQNINLKLMDGKTYSIKSSLVLTSAPLSVCKVNSSEAAVGLHISSIEIVSTRDTLVSLRSISVSYGRKAIAVASDKMYVSCYGNRVETYKLDGKRLNTIRKDKSGNDIFSYVNDIAISKNGGMIHVADRHQGVITLDADGNVVWKCSDENLRLSIGLCTDDNGNVFVCGHSSDNVIQLGPDGQYIGKVVFASKDVNSVKTVCCASNGRKLIVGKLSDNIKVVVVVQRLRNINL